MGIEGLLTLLKKVRKVSNRWVACCPAHNDHSPSLSIKEGEKGLLVHCWVGCTIGEICESLGMKVKDLFYTARLDPSAFRKVQQKRQEEATKNNIRGLEASRLREADRLIRSAKGINISRWNPARLDKELNLLADAYQFLEVERVTDVES